MLKTSLKSKKNKFRPGKSRAEIVKENRLKKFKSKTWIRKFHLGKKLKKVALVIAGVFFIAIAVGVVVLLSYLQDINNKLPSPDKIFPEVPLATEIFDRHGLDGENQGTRLYRLFGENNSDKVDIKDIPDILKASFIAAEDDNFYNHHGYDPQAILRCAINAIRKENLCGGSTITQQLIKLVTLDNSSSLDRKIRELLMAIKVEDNYSKDQILEMYLRVTSYGSNIVGVKAAAQFYFGKELKDLDLAQSAILAAIVRNPPKLSPTLGGDTETSQKLVKERQEFILDQLSQKLDQFNAELKKNKGDPNGPDIITQQMIDDARKEVLVYNPPIATDIKAGHFVDYVLGELQSRNYNNGQPFTLSELQTGGYKIYTTLDYGLEQVAEKYVQSAGNDYTYWNMYNAAVMTTQPSTGQIITMAGSKTFYGESEGCDGSGQNCKFDPQVNVLTSLQSTGSSNKPLGYYLAFKMGKLAPGSILPDVPIRIGAYEPKNWEGSYYGPHSSARNMLRESRNIPALTVAEIIGVDTYIKTAQEWGYTTMTGDLGPSVIIGGVDVYPIEHVQAYGVFANGGDFVQLDPILKIIDKDGKTIYDANPQRKQVGDPQGIWLLNQTIYRLDSLGASTAWDDRDMAAKTGTTEENKDALVVMYSPDFVTYGWGGNNNNDPLDQNNGWPANVVIPWVKQYMSEISGGWFLTPKTPFSRPGYVYQGGGSNDCNEKGECLGIEGGWLIQGREPARGDFVRKKVMVCTDQQDHVARPIDITLGLAVQKEFIYYKDPFPDFQGFVDAWVQSKNGVPNGGPTASCTIPRGGGQTVFFNSLGANFVDNSTPIPDKLHILGGAYSLNGNVTSVSFVLNNGATLSSCATNTNLTNIDITCDVSGVHNNTTYTLTGTATDSQGVSGTGTAEVSWNYVPPVSFP